MLPSSPSATTTTPINNNIHSHANDLSRKRCVDNQESDAAETSLDASQKKQCSQETGAQRSQHSKEQYYTKPDVAQMCVEKVAELNYKFDTIIDPAAGAGSFLGPIQRLLQYRHLIASDIDPKADGIERADFLSGNDAAYSRSNGEHVMVITNPPFGRGASLARKFIKESIRIGCNVIAMILPASFGKETRQRYFDDHFHLLSEEPLPKKAFQVNGSTYNKPLKTVFQIWELKPFPRQIPPIVAATNFCFLKKDDLLIAQVAIRKNGGSAGVACIATALTEGSKSHYHLIQAASLATHTHQQHFCNIFNEF